tara:strand:+ start:2177 stop:3292 length:1116 start_codon:yes stop_codon:yes gene_type:complete
MLNLDNAEPITNPRTEELREALLSVRDLNLDLSSDYLVKNWFSMDAISVIYGDSNCGKSFLALDIAGHIAAGVDWMDNRVRQGKVLYLASEGGKGFAKRIAAINQENNILFEGMADNLQLLPVQVDFNGEDDVNAVISLIQEQDFSLIVVDTLAMTMGAGSENDGADMGRYIKNIMLLKSIFKCHVMIIHHSGKDRGKGARGHSSLRAAVDTEIEVKAEKLIRFAKSNKQRDLENGKEVAFSLQRVELGWDEDWDPITSCVVKPEELSSSSSHIKCRPKGLALIALQALHDALAKDGRKLHDAESYPQNRNIVNVDRWRDSYMRMRADSKAQESSIKRVFRRHVKELEDLDLTRSYDDNVWLVHDEDRQDK